MNDIIVIGLIAVVVAQILKLPIYYIKHDKIYLPIVLSTGSMPSSHTSFVVSVSYAIGLVDGFDTSIYALSFVFAAIVIHDAVKVRGESSKHAIVLNQLTETVQEMGELINFRNSKNEREKKLKELVGHTTSEVIVGFIIGIIVAMVYFQLFM